MRLRRLFPLAILLGAVLPAAATLVVPMDLPELVENANVIAVGHVADARAVVIDGQTETVVTLAADEYLKGDGGPHLAFRVPGGQIGRYRTVVVGAPVLDEGDEVVAFLAGERGLQTVVGFSQGVLRVYRQTMDGMPMVLAPPVSRDGARDQRVARGEAPRRFVPLSSFLDSVRGLAAARSSAQGVR